MQASNQVIVARRLAKTFESAKSRGKEFNLTFEYMTNILAQTHCAYSGEKFAEFGLDSMTLERWDNDKGYVIGNVIPVKEKYNSIRSDYSIEQMEALAKEKSARIVRGSDNKPVTLADETQAKIEIIEKNIEAIKARLEGRIAALNSRLSEETLDEAGKVMVASLKARIEGGKAEMGRQEAKLFALRDGRSIKNATKLSKAEEQVRSYGIIVEALKRLEKRNWLDTKKLEKGLSLNCSLLQLIKGKM